MGGQLHPCGGSCSGLLLAQAPLFHGVGDLRARTSRSREPNRVSSRGPNSAQCPTMTSSARARNSGARSPGRAASTATTTAACARLAPPAATAARSCSCRASPAARFCLRPGRSGTGGSPTPARNPPTARRARQRHRQHRPARAASANASWSRCKLQQRRRRLATGHEHGVHVGHGLQPVADLHRGGHDRMPREESRVDCHAPELDATTDTRTPLRTVGSSLWTEGNSPISVDGSRSGPPRCATWLLIAQVLVPLGRS